MLVLGLGPAEAIVAILAGLAELALAGADRVEVAGPGGAIESRRLRPEC